MLLLGGFLVSTLGSGGVGNLPLWAYLRVNVMLGSLLYARLLLGSLFLLCFLLISLLAGRLLPAAARK